MHVARFILLICCLLFIEHTNPIAIFNRMPDAATFPSAPGQPTILNVTDESVSLTWTAPEKQGASPVIGYILQYFSPEQGQVSIWINGYICVSTTTFSAVVKCAGLY
jgi:roundabout axon guidance receptor 2